jgi:CheY-like chemotaxis protein
MSEPGMETGGTLRVLIAEDDEQIAGTLADILQGAGYQTAIAADGAAAVEHIRRGDEFHAVILDLVMPHLDGMTALRYIRQLRPHLKPVILAADITAEDRRAALDFGAAVVLQKPTDIPQLLEVLGRLANGAGQD